MHCAAALFCIYFLHRPAGGHELPQAGSPLTGGSLFSAPAERGTRTASAGSPLTGGFFSAPAERGTRTALACSPLTGGKFFAEPQWGDSPSADGGSVAAPAAGAKRKDNLRFSFLFELLPFPYSLVWRRLPTCDRFEKENGRGFLLPCLSLPIRSVRYRTATQIGESAQVRHNSAAQFFSALLLTGPAKINCTKRLNRRCRAVQRVKELRGTVMPRLRRAARMCSSTLSVNCEYVAKQTQE